MYRFGVKNDNDGTMLFYKFNNDYTWKEVPQPFVPFANIGKGDEDNNSNDEKPSRNTLVIRKEGATTTNSIFSSIFITRPTLRLKSQLKVLSQLMIITLRRAYKKRLALCPTHYYLTSSMARPAWKE